MGPSKAERIREALDDGFTRSDTIREVEAILAEPDPPTSDAAAEIVAMLEGYAARFGDVLGAPTVAGDLAAKAREILAHHQARRVVAVELDEDFVAQHPQPTEEA